VAFKITSQILKYGFISDQDFARLTYTTQRKNDLLSLNILVNVLGPKGITFHSKPVEIVSQQIVKAVAAGAEHGSA